MQVQLLNHSDVRMPRKFLQKWTTLIAKELHPATSPKQRSLLVRELVVVFLDTADARKLNRQFRQRNYATDVLSFAPTDGTQLGELVICPQVVRRQALEHGWSFQIELSYMVLHGVLHLLGYDHEGSARQARRMFALQDKIFARAARKMHLDW
jgi:probable rRNA maturation factor